MAQKNSMPIENFKKLCDFNGTVYESKKGNEYIKALSKIFELNNTNDKPFTKEDILKQPKLKDFTFDGVKDFEYICKLRVKPLNITKEGKRKNERIQAYDFVSEREKGIFNGALGVAYMFTCTIEDNEYIIKIGNTRTTFKKRLGSYNCGVVNNWRTASTTNIKILQSMVTTREELNLYLYDCSEDKVSIEWRGIKSVPFASPKTLAVEDIMIKQFKKQFGKKPLANVQANATEVEELIFD